MHIITDYGEKNMRNVSKWTEAALDIICFKRQHGNDKFPKHEGIDYIDQTQDMLGAIYTIEDVRPILIGLTEYEHVKSTLCDGKALGKPDDNDETSEWVWTTFAPDGSASVVLNPNGGVDGKPNIGCMWRCKDGYTLREIDSGVSVESSSSSSTMKLSYCVQ